jgi:outer membrane protein assembly factor BamB
VDLDGTVLHSTPTGQQDIVAMAIGADDTVYLGGKHVDGTELVAIDANGDVLWRTAADHQILTISLGRDFVLVNRFHDELGWRLGAYSLDGELLWERGDDIIPSSSQQGSIGADGTIYIGALEKADSSVWLYALDGSNGETLWKAGHSCSKVAIGDNGKLYTVCLLEGDYGDGWHFVALDADDGEITWQYELQDTIGSGGGEIHNAPVMCAGKAYWGIGYYQSLLWGFDHMPYLDPDAPWPRDFGNNANNSQVQ